MAATATRRVSRRQYNISYEILFYLHCLLSQDCTIEIARLQEKLTSSLPLSVFEELVEERNTHNGACGQLLWSKDPRIKLAVFLHPSISSFNVDAKVRGDI